MGYAGYITWDVNDNSTSLNSRKCNYSTIILSGHKKKPKKILPASSPTLAIPANDIKNFHLTPEVLVIV